MEIGYISDSNRSQGFDSIGVLTEIPEVGVGEDQREYSDFSDQNLPPPINFEHEVVSPLNLNGQNVASNDDLGREESK